MAAAGRPAAPPPPLGLPEPLLPRPRHVEELRQLGYTVAPSLLPEPLLDQLQRALERQLQAEGIRAGSEFRTEAGPHPFCACSITTPTVYIHLVGMAAERSASARVHCDRPSLCLGRSGACCGSRGQGSVV
eukprot:COSAG01_NODE_499_length_16240_cov_43.337092_8_plen_131_part_00